MAPAGEIYRAHLGATSEWIAESIRHGNGGSCAFFTLAGGWAKPYPETTGYLIPTLLALSEALPGFDGGSQAVSLGQWLLSLQDKEGWWRGGVHPPRGDSGPSVFNTAQVLQGLVALYDLDGDAAWLDAASRGSRWLASGVGEDGLWTERDYRAAETPSYYTYAAWPMLEVAARSGDEGVRAAAEGVLEAIIGRRRENGSFADWGFTEGGKAFTHTIAYTFQGLIGAAKLTDDWPRFGAPLEQGLLTLADRARQAAGRLPGMLDERWLPAARYVCLTGNSQIAICLLDLDQMRPEPRLKEAAAGLVDAVCDAQRLRTPIRGLRGAVGGSSPVWGRYMVMRYPNWAAKYHCDALLRLIADQPQA